MKPIFIAGPHGSGKTTLISKLIVKSDRFIKDDYEIDFSNDMETLSSMTIFEKCLIRLLLLSAQLNPQGQLHILPQQQQKNLQFTFI